MNKIVLLFISISLLLSGCTKSAIEGLTLEESIYAGNYDIPTLVITDAAYHPTGGFGNTSIVGVNFKINPDFVLPEDEPYIIELIKNDVHVGTKQQGQFYWRDINGLIPGSYKYQVHLKFESKLPSIISEPKTVIIP